MIKANFKDISPGEVLWLSESLWQYDSGQQLQITNLSGIGETTEVHFGLKYSDRAIVKTGEFDAESNTLTVDIPNKFLEFADGAPSRIWVHLRESESKSNTIREIQIRVEPRKKPDGYISPDDETSREIIVRAVEEYLDEHGADVSGMEAVKNKVQSIGSQSQTGDNDKYPSVTAARNYVNTKTDDLQDYIEGELDGLDEAKADKADTNAQFERLITVLQSKAGKAETLAGYGINDAYTKAETDSLVSTNAKSAYEIAVENGYTGTVQEWLASLCASQPVVLSSADYPTESAAVEFMNSRQDKTKVYVWNNRLYCYSEHEETQLSGACLYGYRASGSSGIVAGEGKSLFIIPTAGFEAPLTIDFTGFALSNTPYIYGSTTTPTTVTNTLINNESYVYAGRTDPITITAEQLLGCAYVMFAVASASKPSQASVTVNGCAVALNVITSPSEIESAIASSSVTVHSYIYSGTDYAAGIGENAKQKYLDSRGTYIYPVPRGYCESKAEYEAGTHYLTKYSLSEITSMLSSLASSHPEYVTEALLGRDESDTYDIKSYVLDAPTAVSSGYQTVVKRSKPVIILTSGLHGVEPDAVHTVYHFMDDLCNHRFESESLLYLYKNVKFVIIPVCNPWGYVNQSYHNCNDVDLNKNFEYGYRTNGSANTGTAAYSEAETRLMKSVFDEYSDAILHLECHGKYGEDTAYDKTIWFSLMSTLKSAVIELSAENTCEKAAMRLKALGFNIGTTAGYITYYGLNGRPKDYTGTKYGMLSATMEGTGKLYGTSGYTADTQKINTETLENFLLEVTAAIESGDYSPLEAD